MSKLKIVTFPSLAYYKRFNLGEKIMQKNFFEIAAFETKCTSNQWTGFYVIGTSAMNGLKHEKIFHDARLLKTEIVSLITEISVIVKFEPWFYSNNWQSHESSSLNQGLK